MTDQQNKYSPEEYVQLANTGYLKKQRCPKHGVYLKKNKWLKKSVCEPCLMEEAAKLKELERVAGSNHLPIKVIKL